MRLTADKSSYISVCRETNGCLGLPRRVTGLCDRCPPPPSPSACSRISCSKHNWTVTYVLFVLKLYSTYHKYDLLLMMHDPQLNVNFDYYWRSEIPLRQREVFYDWGNFLFLLKVKKLFYLESRENLSKIVFPLNWIKVFRQAGSELSRAKLRTASHFSF